MAIPKQIGWSEKSNLLWEVSNQIDRLLGVIGGQGSTITITSSTTTTTTTICLDFINSIIISGGSYTDANGTYTRDNSIDAFTKIGGNGSIFFGGDAWYIFNTGIGNVARNTSELGTGTWEPWAPGSSTGITAEYFSFICGCLNCVEQDVDINGQFWMKCNLNVDTYNDNFPIPQVQDQAIWDTLTTGAWCYVNNDPANGPIYGKLYNWYAVMGIYDPASLINPALRKKLGPDGYRVPSKSDFETLFNFTDPASGGGTIVPNTAGSPLKEVGNCHWNINTDATNSTGFTAFGGGGRLLEGVAFFGRNDIGIFSTITEVPLSDDIYLPYVNASEPTALFAVGGNNTSKKIGASVRLIKD
jgi:uncharacterized protein (TIGR02145 family)